MKFSEQWLRSWVNPPVSSDDLVARLSMAGLEVDSVTPAAGQFSGVVVGEILSAEQHPDADKLQLCEVQIGEEQLSGAQSRVFGGERLLDLDEQFRRGEDLGRVGHQFGAGLPVLVVAQPAAGPGAGLDQNPVAILDQGAHTGRGHADPVLLALDFPWHADNHGLPPAAPLFRSANRC